MNTVQVNNWLGLSSFEIMRKFTTLVNETVAAAYTGNLDETLKKYDIMLNAEKEIKPLVIEEKTYQWQFKDHNEHYANWEDCLQYINDYCDHKFQNYLANVIKGITGKEL